MLRRGRIQDRQAGSDSPPGEFCHQRQDLADWGSLVPLEFLCQFVPMTGWEGDRRGSSISYHICFGLKHVFVPYQVRHPPLLSASGRGSYSWAGSGLSLVAPSFHTASQPGETLWRMISGREQWDRDSPKPQVQSRMQQDPLEHPFHLLDRR